MKRIIMSILAITMSVSLMSCNKSVTDSHTSNPLNSGGESTMSSGTQSQSSNGSETESSQTSSQIPSATTSLSSSKGSTGTTSTTSKPLYNTPITVSTVKKTADGKAYLEVSGKPFLMIGSQIRTDFLANVDFLNLSEMEPYFTAAAKLGVTCVQVPIQWSDVEGDENDYIFNKIDTFMHYVNKYNMKMEILWFGSNMCGDTHSFHIPEYVYRDKDRFPRRGDDSFWDMYGNVIFLKMDDPDLIQRESKAIKAMMDHVWEWDRTHGAKNPVISVQIENEPDSYPRWRGGNWDELYTQLNEIGKAAKSGKYKVVTRVNVCVMLDTADWVKKIYQLDGIDIVGSDPYVFSAKEIKIMINNFASKLPGNFPHVAENKGAVSNLDTLMLSAIATGGGFNIYELATMKYDGRYTEDFGVLNRNLTDKAHTQQVRTLIAGLKAAWSEVVLTDKEDFAAFNINSSRTKASLTQTVTAGNVKMTYKTTDTGIAFATVRNGYITAFSSKNGSITFENATLGAVEIGTYSASGSFTKTASASLSGSTLTMQAGKVYRLKLTRVNGTLSSTAQSNIGNEVTTTVMGNFTPVKGDWSYNNGTYTSYLMFENSALQYNTASIKEFTFNCNVQPGFIGGEGFGLSFGNGDYVKINPSWSQIYVTVKVNDSQKNFSTSLNSQVGKSYALSIELNNGQIKVTYGGKQLYSGNATAANGKVHLVSYGFHGDFSQVSLSAK